MFPDVPEDLTGLSDQELQELHDQLVGAFNEAAEDPSADLEELGQVTESIERIRTEQASREEATAERQAQVDELRTRVNASDAGTETADEDAEAEGDSDEDDTEADDESTDDNAEADTSSETDAEETEKASVTASAKKKSKSKPTLSKLRNTPAKTKPRQEAHVGNGFSLTAAADVSGFAAGQQISSPKELAQAMINRKHSMGRGNGDNVIVATFHREFEKDRQFTRDMSPGEIQSRIESFEAGDFNSIVAAGGLCAPVAGYYDQFVMSETGRPVRDALANFGADRGGIRLVPPPTLADLTGGVGIRTAAQDAAGTPTKSCFTVVCDDVEETVISAIYSCLTFGNMGSLTFPERVQAWDRLALIKYDNMAETMLLDAIATLSTPVTMTGVVGAGREIFARVGQAAAAYRSRHRMNPEAPLRLMLPAWVKELVRSDLARTLGDPQNVLAITEAMIDNWFSVRHIRPTWYLDSKTGGNQVIGAATGGSTYTDLATTSGAATITSASAGFTSADVGKTIVGTGIPASTTILSVQSATGATMSANATATASGVTFTIGRPVASQFPNLIFGYLFAEGTLLHLDGGTLDIGLVRDSTLNASNNYQIFNEGFENVAKVGGESVELRLTLNADGSYGAAKTVPNPINF